MDWRVKGAVQKSLSLLPFAAEANDVLRRLVRGQRHLDREIAIKVRNDWLVIARHMNRMAIPVRGRELLEIGSGWYPTLPMCFALSGAGRCHTFDLVAHMDAGATLRMLAALRAHVPAIAEAAGRAAAEVEAELQAIVAARDLAGVLERARIAYHAPADAAATGLPADSIDVVFSNSVLEHVPAEVIRRMMAETFRVLKPGGHAIHSVNCGDHYAYFDRKITQVNYLAFSERQWRFWNNDLQYQNRLRACDFLEMATAAGLEIAFEAHHAKPFLLDKVRHMAVAPEFRRYPEEQLACTSIDFVARKPDR